MGGVRRRCGSAATLWGCHARPSAPTDTRPTYCNRPEHLILRREQIGPRRYARAGTRTEFHVHVGLRLGRGHQVLRRRDCAGGGLDLRKFPDRRCGGLHCCHRNFNGAIIDAIGAAMTRPPAATTAATPGTMPASPVLAGGAVGTDIAALRLGNAGVGDRSRVNRQYPATSPGQARRPPRRGKADAAVAGVLAKACAPRRCARPRRGRGCAPRPEGRAAAVPVRCVPRHRDGLGEGRPVADVVFAQRRAESDLAFQG